MSDVPQTWHHGLMARWWAELNEPEPVELAYYRGAIERFGQPALDLACGVGRLLVPLAASGLDVDGVDASTDMLAHARRLAEARGLTPSLAAQPMHELDLPRRYGTIFICDSFGIGGRRRLAFQALHRILEHLQPGGAVVFSHDLPYAAGEADWNGWMRGTRSSPEPWPDRGDRRRLADGDELELLVRERSFDPLLQEEVLEVRARRWRHGERVEQEDHSILLPLFFAQEIVLMLETVGFTDVMIQGRYTAEPATGDDKTVVFLARRPGWQM